MSNDKCTDARPRELGAVSIKTILVLLLLATAAFLLIKLVPAYVDERQVTFKVEDLANKSAVRNSKEVDIQKAIEVITKEYDLPENSINIVSREQGRVQISINYQRSIDLVVATYQWKVTHTAAGKDL
jgi:hypothetical protein